MPLPCGRKQNEKKTNKNKKQQQRQNSCSPHVCAHKTRTQHLIAFHRAYATIIQQLQLNWQSQQNKSYLGHCESRFFFSRSTTKSVSHAATQLARTNGFGHCVVSRARDWRPRDPTLGVLAKSSHSIAVVSPGLLARCNRRSRHVRSDL